MNATKRVFTEVDLTPTSDWEDVEIWQLSTGRVVKTRRPDLLTLIGSKDAPDVLTNIILAQMNNQRQELKITGETLPDILASTNLIALECLIFPRLETDPKLAGQSGEDWIHIGKMLFVEKTEIFAWALGVQYEAAKNFPDGQANKPVGAVSQKPRQRRKPK